MLDDLDNEQLDTLVKYYTWLANDPTYSDSDLRGAVRVLIRCLQEELAERRELEELT